MATESKYINPFVDWSFKYIFGRESVKDILIGFLNAVMQGEHVIKDVTYLNNEHPRKEAEGKTIIYDLLCQTDCDEYVIVEMQNKEKAYFTDRALYYTSRAIAEQGEKGGWEYQLKAVYGIFFLNFELPQNAEKTNSRTEVALVDVETGKVFNQKMKQIFIELPRFNKTEQECISDYDQWIFILKNMTTMNRMPFIDRNAVFARLEETAAKASLSKEERVVYEAELKTYRDYFSELDFADAKGEKRGIDKGLLIAAQRMLGSGIAKEEVIKILSLSPEQAKEL